jgi:mRNA interferase HicA
MRLPTLKPREVVRVLKRAGFIETRQTGSHLMLRHPVTKKTIPVPMHARDIKRGLLMSIIKQANLSQQEFLEFFRKKH